MYDTALAARATGHDIVLIATAREAPEYTKTAADFEALAKELGVPFIKTAKIMNAREQIETAESADIALSVNYTGIIPQELIDLFPLGVLNAHGGDLPRYRGNACQAWAILNGEERIGLCIHSMIGGELDSGDIIARDYFPVTLETKVGQAWEWMHARIPQLFMDAVDRLATDPFYVLEAQSKEAGAALRCYPRKPEDGRIDWSRPAREILRLINASGKPYAGAFCALGDKKLVVWDAALPEGDDEQYLAIPGQVTAIGEGFADIATGTGKLRLRQVEVDGALASPDQCISSLRERLS
jgi:UDP-4-amino-4-deoxy-L-arabinose formyltransferase/UDP-glucuronic acid dehydrogenase (UDP-4-keto-hexauronic acid decarboxylating)